MTNKFQVSFQEETKIEFKQFDQQTLLKLLDKEKEEQYLPPGSKKVEEEPQRKIIASSIDLQDPKLIYTNGKHSFVDCCIRAYSNHHGLVIRPDDVWLAIVTQFSFYVDGRSEMLRDRFVDFKGKKELVVEGYGTLETANYKEFHLKMADQIESNIKDQSIKDWILPNFTTTTLNDRVVGAISLMSSMKSYFQYKYYLRCGLPTVTLLGTVEDWQLIKDKCSRLLEFQVDGEEEYLKEWVTLLNPILDQFIDTSKNNQDVEWWNRIANRISGGSGPSFISGWITVFCVFDSKGNWIAKKREFKSMFGQLTISEWPLIDTNDLPPGYSSTPLTIDDNGTIYQTELFAGHIASSIGENDSTLEPRLDWVLLLNK